MVNISFVIPTYNNKELLERCLNILAHQIDKDDQVIVINDGSTDSTKEFLESFGEFNCEWVYVNQNNSGSGPSRNKGLDLATRENIWFIDADDYLIEGSVEKVKKHLNEHNDVDVLFIEYIFASSEKARYVNLNFSEDDKLECMFTQHYPWNKIVKKNLYNEIRFPNEQMRYQDLATIPKVLMKSRKIGILHEKLYYYDFGHPNNITKNIEKERDIFKALDYLWDFSKSKEIEILSIYLLLYNRLFFSPTSKVKDVKNQVSNILNYLDRKLPLWRKSEYLKYREMKQFKKNIPNFGVKLILINILKISPKLAILVIALIIKGKKNLKGIFRRIR